MRQVKYAKALREAHEKTARALAEREAAGLAGKAPADGYLEQMEARIKQMVTETHRAHDVPASMDDLMMIFTLQAFLERLDEIVGSAATAAANDAG